jgi:hypothetical protein
MRKVLYFNEFGDNIYESKSSNFFVYAALAALLGLKILPTVLRSDSAQKSMAYLSKRTENLNDYSGSKYDLERAKESVISKIKNKENILNKEELIDRVKNVIVKEIKDNDVVAPNSNMYYFKYSDKDYIVVNRKNSNHDYQTFIHELNHLLDHRKVVKDNIDIKYLINKDIDINDYSRFVKMNFPLVLDDEKELRPEILLNSWEFFEKNKGYLLSDSEVYARLSSMRVYLINNNYIKEGDKLTKDVVYRFFEDLSKRKISSYDYYELFDELDFLLITPCINWDYEKEIDLISYNKNKEDDRKWT